MPASVTMKDETPIFVTHQPCHAPISRPTASDSSTATIGSTLELDRQHREDDANQRHGRADREIEVARDDQHHRADRGERDDRRLQRQEDQVALREEGALGREIEEQPDHREDQQQRRVAQRRGC